MNRGPLERCDMGMKAKGWWRGRVEFLQIRLQGNKPKSLNLSLSIRYKNPVRNKPKACIFHTINGIQPDSGRFSTNMNARDRSRIWLW